MPGFTHFSRHAFLRVVQRTKLSCEEIARILDRGLTVDTGRMPGFNRVHLLFYSVPDDDFFVAIRDGLTGTVVTILPLEYHANLAWRVADADCTKARSLVLAAPPDLRSALKPTAFVVTAHHLTAEGRQKAKIILKAASAAYHDDLKQFLTSRDVFSNMGTFAAAKGIDPARMFAISVRHGNKGDPIRIDLREVRTVTPL
jgi:hypothetical protein